MSTVIVCCSYLKDRAYFRTKVVSNFDRNQYKSFLKYKSFLSKMMRKKITKLSKSKGIIVTGCTKVKGVNTTKNWISRT